MSNQCKAVIFDLDGTLLDTRGGVIDSARYTIEHFGFPTISEEQLKTFIGPPIQVSFAKTYGLEGDILQEIATVFRNEYKDHNLLKAVPYDGIYETCQALVDHGIPQAVATYKRQDYARDLLIHFGFDRYTSIMYGGDHENKLSKSDIIELALRDCGITDYSEAVMIGDSDNDAIGAAKLGIPFIGVTWGFGFHDDEDVNQYPNVGIAHHPAELTSLLTACQK